MRTETCDYLAAKMLARYGNKFIWDTHVAAAAAYGLGNLRIAEDLLQIAEAAEKLTLETQAVVSE